MFLLIHRRCCNDDFAVLVFQTDLISIREPADYAVFLPDGLPETFQSSDFGRKAGISRDLAGIALNILLDMQIVERIGKNGNAYIYSPIYTSRPSSS